jgi:hypothetical protein
MESGSLNLLELSGPHRACYGTIPLSISTQQDTVWEADICSVIKSLAFYVSRKFCAALPTAYQWSTSWTDQSGPQPHTLSLQSIIATPSLYACLSAKRFLLCKLSDELFVSPTHANYVLCQCRCDSSVSIVTRCQAGIPRVWIRAELWESSLLRSSHTSSAAHPASRSICTLYSGVQVTRTWSWCTHLKLVPSAPFPQHACTACKGEHHCTTQKTHCIPSERPISCLFWQHEQNMQTQCVIRMQRIWALKQY